MKTTRFGFGSTAQHTQLGVRRSIVKNALAAASPAFFCLLVTACAALQPFSTQSNPDFPLQSASADTASQSNDTCEFGDMNCVARQSEIQTEQADFLARQYPRILKDAQILEASRARRYGPSLPRDNTRLAEIAMRTRMMTQVYNFHAARTDPALLSTDHLPAKIAP